MVKHGPVKREEQRHTERSRGNWEKRQLDPCSFSTSGYSHQMVSLFWILQNSLTSQQIHFFPPQVNLGCCQLLAIKRMLTKTVCLYFGGRWNHSKCQVYAVTSSPFPRGFCESRVVFISPAKPLIFSYLDAVNKCTYLHSSQMRVSMLSVKSVGREMLIQTPLPHADTKW